MNAPINTFEGFKEIVTLYWYKTTGGNKTKKDGYMASESELRQLYDKFNKAKLNAGHLSVINDIVCLTESYEYDNYIKAFEKVRKYKGLARYISVACSCGNFFAVLSAPCVLQPHSQINCPCKRSYTGGYLLLQVLNNNSTGIFIGEN